jgi:hypothetical protein
MRLVVSVPFLPRLPLVLLAAALAAGVPARAAAAPSDVSDQRAAERVAHDAVDEAFAVGARNPDREGLTRAPSSSSPTRRASAPVSISWTRSCCIRAFATSARPPGPIRATPTSTPMRFATASRSRPRARFGSAARAGNVPYVPEKVFAGDIGEHAAVKAWVLGPDRSRAGL